MKRLLFVLTILPLFTIGQTISLHTETIGDSLRTSSIDTFIVYKNSFPGSDIVITVPENATEGEVENMNCEKSDAVYIIYKQNGQAYIQKRNKCNIFKTIRMETSKAISFFLSHSVSILNENILINSHEDHEGQIIKSYIDHVENTDIYLSVGTIAKFNRINWFDLYRTDNYLDETKGNTNMNYEYNKKTKIINLISLIEDEIRELTFIKN